MREPGPMPDSRESYDLEVETQAELHGARRIRQAVVRDRLAILLRVGLVGHVRAVVLRG